MKNISENMRNHLASDLTTLAKFIKISKGDFFLGLTNLQEKFTFETLEYQPLIDTENFNFASNNSIKNKEDFLGSFESDLITENIIKSGFFDDTDIEIFLLNYKNTSDGKVILKKGFISKIIFDNNKYIFEISSYAKHLENIITQNYSPNCRARFCDAKCKLNREDFSFNGSVTQEISNISFKDDSLTQGSGYFNFGLVEFTSGANQGIIREIAEYSEQIIKLKTPLPFNIEVGDDYKISAGCDKKFSTCVSKFNNAVNFRGEPHIPGINKIFANI
ncbi:MAG: DUF2163 domain-containing protein [Rickettsiales bacterium]|nr:DUF2163 domain-containing protein [Rickettsiales bacterium]